MLIEDGNISRAKNDLGRGGAYQQVITHGLTAFCRDQQDMEMVACSSDEVGEGSGQGLLCLDQEGCGAVDQQDMVPYL